MATTKKSDARPEMVEVVDALDRPLLVMPLAEAHRQGLFHRTVFVLVYDPQGRLFLQKRGAKKNLYPGRYDLSATGHVQAGESREDAAIRELREELGLGVPALTWMDVAPASEETAFEFVTLFSAGRLAETPRPNPDEVDGGLFVDRDELAALMRDFREMLTPGVVHFFEKHALFPENRTSPRPIAGFPPGRHPRAVPE